MREIPKISEALFEKIRDRFEDVSLGDENAKAVQKPEDARFFNFDYDDNGQNFGNITISLIDETSLKVYFSKNISDGLDDDQKTKWYAFLRELREFAKRNLLSFEPRDITRSTLKHRDIQQVSKADSTYSADEVIGEGRMYGNKHTSFEDRSSARIIVRHTESVDPEKRGARSRKIASIFVETSEGERFKLPYKNLRYARAMARHISEGGLMSDDFGQHITQIAEECSKLRPFKNSMRRRTFEDEETSAMVEAAFEYHSQLNNTLKRISGRKGYQSCKENYQSDELILDEFDADSLRERFVKRLYNEQMDDALPIVQKAYTMKKQNKFSENFEKWADHVTEGSWALPTEDNLDELIELMANPLPLGVDAMNATTALYNIVGNDDLYDLLSEVAGDNPDADARSMVVDWLKENMPEVYDKLMAELDTDEQPVAEAGILKTIKRKLNKTDLKSRRGEEASKGFDAVMHGDNKASKQALRNLNRLDNLHDKDLSEGSSISDEWNRGFEDGYKQAKVSIEDENNEDYQNGYNEGWKDRRDEMRYDIGEGDDEESKVARRMRNFKFDPETDEESDANDQEAWYGDRDDELDEGDEHWDHGELNPTSSDDYQSSEEAVTSAIINRILRGNHSELIRKLGPDGVMDAAKHKAEWIGDVAEIGSSDVSIWVRDIEREAGITELAEGKINELSKKTLGNYIKKASKSASDGAYKQGVSRVQGDDTFASGEKIEQKRKKGIDKAVSKLTKEGVTEGATTAQGNWYVYDKKTGDVKKKYSSHEKAKEYAHWMELDVASAEYWHDNINPANKQVTEGKVKELSMDLEELTDAEFKKKYNMTKAEAKKGLNESTEVAPDIKAVYAKIKDWDYKALKGYARKVGVWDEAVNSLGRGDEFQIIDEILGELFGDYDQRDLLDDDTMFNESLAQIRKIAGLTKGE